MKEQEYIQLVKLHSTALYRFLYKNFNDKYVCEDIVQEAFIKLWENRNSIDPLKVKAWLYSVSYRKMIDYIRSIKKFSNVPEDEIMCITAFQSNKDDTDLVNKYIDKLNVMYKSILILRDIEGYSYEDIEEILHLSAAQVKVNLFRARKQLKELIEKHEIWASR
jgi:RNA polymerase sigma factor (sigma-70 family)